MATDQLQTIGTELVKIILLTIPYIMAAAPGQWDQRAAELMDKTDIIASEPHALQALIDPYHPEDKDSPTATQSLIGLLQKQLQAESSNGWQLACLPRPWKFPIEEIEQQQKLDEATKHDLPAIKVPESVVAGARTLFPEVYFSVYGTQEIVTVPSVTSVAASLVRDGLLDTINALDFNRNITARFLIDVDCYFAPGTFVKRATPFDKLRELSEAEPDRPTWKPEDVAVDAVFSQLFLLPAPEHKLIYYHSVLTEACKLAPAAIAPSLGRAIRFLYRTAPLMDLELANRFMDWFSHHLSNFGFTWKWVEWVDDVALPEADPQKAFILGAIDKEIRLSFAQRIKNTLPDPYKPLIGPEKEQDSPEPKFKDDRTYPKLDAVI
jgi:nuclear cap-binding protein subunit 1